MTSNEGYIKFDLDWTKAPIPQAGFISEINYYRSELFNLGLIGQNDDGVGYGNISVRLNKTEFLISGSRTGGIPTLGPGHYTIVEKYDIGRNKLWCRGPVEASSESLTHAAVYGCSSSNAVIHVHNLEIWRKYLNKLPTTKEYVRYGTPAMANEIQRIVSGAGNQQANVRQANAIIMGGHESGIIIYDNSIKETFRIVKGLLN